MKKVSILTLLFISIVTNTYSCDCVSTSFKEAIENYESIFSAKVLNITDIPESCYKGDCLAVTVELEIIENFREANMDTITVYTGKYTPSCGYPFEVGNSYLVYVSNQNENYNVSLCSRTSLLEKAADDIKLLNELFKK